MCNVVNTIEILLYFYTVALSIVCVQCTTWLFLAVPYFCAFLYVSQVLSGFIVVVGVIVVVIFVIIVVEVLS
jgi:hypothetical protein